MLCLTSVKLHYSVVIVYDHQMIMIMIIFTHNKDILQIMVTNKQQSPNLRIPVESYKKNLFG